MARVWFFAWLRQCGTKTMAWLLHSQTPELLSGHLSTEFDNKRSFEESHVPYAMVADGGLPKRLGVY